MKIFRLLHTGYGMLVFMLLFLIFFPLLLIPIVWPRQFHLVGVFNRWWARLLFLLVFIPFNVIYRQRLDPRQRYVFCPNHFSYLDIPAMGLIHENAVFVGKNDMEKIPLFGFMYRKLHITVDRASLKSRVNTIRQSLEAVDQGKNLVIFPEGGIITLKDPVMARFKDGAFRIAIEKQIAVVPVTIPYNWIILPPDQFLLRWHRLRMIVHEPISTEGLTLDDVDTLKARVFDVIHTELQQYLTA